ncbi:MAG: GLPGLI family protein [Mucilaginibacter sp.]|uniref:GLPGLI family protein n=1 Tax=Mucilaginibacter sp. TaxID=1882438 RepID=UPI0034E452EE
MMKTILNLCLISMLFTKLSYGQTAEPAQAQATYHFMHVRDTTDRTHPYTEDLLLLLGRNSSACTSIDARLQIENVVKEVQNQIKNATDPNHLNLNISAKRPVSDEYFQFFTAHKSFTKKNLINDYLVEEPMPVINWKIMSDTLTVSGLHCQKATTAFKGRNYEAWFCPALPFRSGPWKLQGLPGLIIEASDSKKEVQFKFAGFEQISDQKQLVKLPEDAIRTTQKEFDRLQEVAKTNPSALSKVAGKSFRSPLDDIDVSKISSINVSRPNYGFSKKVNNPIELTEK